MSEVAKIEDYKGIELDIQDAVIKRISVKTNSLGASVATIQVEVESDNPERDFDGIMQLQRQYVGLRIRGEKVRTAD